MAMDYREKEHAFITIEKDLKGGKVPRVVLLCGCFPFSSCSFK